MQNNLTIMFTNIDIISNKLNEFEAFISLHHPSIICLNEICCKSNSDPNDIYNLELNGYDKFIPNSNNRGSVIFIHSSITAQLDDYLCNISPPDCIWVQITVDKHKITLGNLYRNPNLNIEQNVSFTNALNQACERNAQKQIIIVGDFNYGEISWSDLTSPHSINHHCSKFLDCVKNNFLEQLVTQTTRQRGNDNPSLLDLILTNDADSISSIQYFPPIGKSDHLVLLFPFFTPQSDNNKTQPSLNYYKGDYDSIRLDLSKIDWKEAFLSKDLDESWTFFKDTLNNLSHKHIRKKRANNKQTPLWFTKSAALALKRKNRAWKRYKSQQTQWAAAKYREARNLCTSTLREIKLNFEKSVAEDAKSNPKSFWNYINSRLKSSHAIPNLIKPDGSLTENDNEKAHVLNNFFCSVFTSENDANVAPKPTISNPNIPKLATLSTCENEVNKLLANLNVNKSPGLDGLHAKLLYETRNEITFPLTEIFNKSLSCGSIPKDWKIAKVVPIFKKGSKTDPGNYRPVSLTSTVCKLLEKIVRDRIESHFDTHKLFSDCQFGFRRGRSCTDQLLAALEDWTTSLNQGHPIDVIMLDFSKAFDRVPHARLINKLQAYGIDGPLKSWINDFLANRSQRVFINNIASENSNVTSGVPQGSVLGPTLFLIFINDISENISSHIKIFADDTKIYRSIQSQNDIQTLQNDIDLLSQWSLTWKLLFNSNKCMHLHVGRDPFHSTYSMPDATARNPISKSNCERDLGVFINSSLKPSDHIAQVVLKTNKVLSAIKRSFTYMDKSMFVSLYKSLVRPIAEYASSVWSPNLKKDIIEIEKIQRRATKLIPDCSDLSYNERLTLLGLPTLLYRRDRQDLIQVYITLKDNNQSFFRLAESNQTRGHSKKILKTEFYTVNSRLYFYSQRVINTWNSLPESVISAPNLNCFKSNLNKANWHSYKFNFPY